MDVMAASFPGDPTAITAKRKLDEDYFPTYAEQYLWRDGPAPLANPPKLRVSQGPIPAAGRIAERVIERDEFDEYIERYWHESTFRYFGGSPAILDLVCFLGRIRSTEDAQHIQAFKEISSLAIRVEMETLLRFGDIRPVSVQFFHVFDECDGAVMNWHVHNLVLLT
jgi:hypothetical protein